MPTNSAPLPRIEAETMRRITWRLLPFFMVCYFISYVDRVNAGFAALQMNKDLGLTQAAFGAGGALFYIAYILFEVPSNLAMQKVGARIWIARIMITWGIVGILSAFAVGPITFYLSRFLLGAAEAGFFPGVILYLTFWFPAAYRARIVAVFMVAIPLSSFLGSPISGALLAMDGLLGLRGWQWLFIVEAIPAVLLGLVSFFGLPNKPADAKWLEAEARNWLDARLQSERSMAKQVGHMSLWQILTNKYVLILGLIYAGSSATSNALSLWQPQIVKSFGMSNMETGFLNAIPFGIASVAMIFWGRYSDRSNAHAQNTAIPLALCATALLATMLTSSLPVTLAILSVVLIGNYSIKGPFWALATGTLSPATAAAGIAGINTLSHIGTSGAVWLLGVIKEATGSFPMALIPLALLQIAGIIAVLWISKQETLPANSAASPVH
jgi:MFS transporter, ACS family, tartrate transporter